MLEYTLDPQTGVLSIRPEDKLTVADFEKLATDVDAYLRENGKLAGLLLTADHLPGWESFAALVQHMRFVRDHQKRIDRVAVVTDNALLKVPPQIFGHFAHPEVRVFSVSERGRADDWLKGALA